MNAQDIIKKYKLDQKTWTQKGFHGVLHYFFPVGEEALKPLYQYWGDTYDLALFFFHDNLGEWYWDNAGLVKMRNSFVNAVNKNPKTLSNLLKEWEKRIVKFNKIMVQVDKTNFTACSNQELLKLYHLWYNAYLQEYGIAIGFQDAFSMTEGDFLRPKLEKVIKDRGYSEKLNEFYLALVSPVTESFIAREYHDRILIALKQKQKKDISKDLQKHIKKYHWLHNNYAQDICLGEDFFRQQLQELEQKDLKKELQKVENEFKEVKKKKQQVLKLLKLNKEEQNLIDITETFAYMQDERKKYVLMATHYENKFIEEFGRRLGLSKKYMEYTYIYELENLLKQKKIDTSIFEERKNYCIAVYTLQGYEVISGKQAKEIHEQLFEKKLDALTEVKGVIACKGKATGPVKIVQKIHDLINVKQGDILLASMTRPEMAIAMKKAAAIVTDEGGITSHAAVISRELRIPCIIGTKIATKIFKDGDVVEVDAEKGTVRKIK